MKVSNNYLSLNDPKKKTATAYVDIINYSGFCDLLHYLKLSLYLLNIQLLGIFNNVDKSVLNNFLSKKHVTKTRTIDYWVGLSRFVIVSTLAEKTTVKKLNRK